MFPQRIELLAFGAIANRCAFLTEQVSSSGQAPRSTASRSVSV